MANPQSNINPQLDDGYMKIQIDVADALPKIRIPGEARQILDFILRKTYGWGKKWDTITLSQLALGTNLSKSSIIRGLKKLIKMNLIYQKVNDKDTFKGNSYMFNKHFDTWKPFTKKSTIYQKVNDHLPKSKKMRLPKSKSTINNYNTKDTITKEIKTYVQEVFLHYCNIMKRDPKQYTLTDAKIKKIKARYKEKFTIEQLKTVIDTCAASKYHMGENEFKTKYNDLINNLFKSREKVEWWLMRAEDVKKQNPKPQIEHIAGIDNPRLYKITFEGNEHTVNLLDYRKATCSCGAGNGTSCQHIIWATNFKDKEK